MNELGQLTLGPSQHSDASFVTEICVYKRLPFVLKQSSASFNDNPFLAHDHMHSLNFSLVLRIKIAINIPSFLYSYHISLSFSLYFGMARPN